MQKVLQFFIPVKKKVQIFLHVVFGGWLWGEAPVEEPGLAEPGVGLGRGKMLVAIAGIAYTCMTSIR